MNRSLLRAALAAVLFCSTLPVIAFTRQPEPLVEEGTFTLHKFEQAIGEETYEIRRDGDSLVTKIEFTFTDRGTAVPLSTTFRAANDWTPQAFDIKGKTARAVSIDQSVTVKDGVVSLLSRDRRSPDTPRPTGSFFTISAYAPVTMQMLLVRYWAAHGSPAQLPLLPSNARARIDRRGTDTFHIDGKDRQLDRYTVEGLIWGRETLWLDSNRMLIAAVSTDAEFDHFEAIRSGYEGALAEFVNKAAADGMQALAEIAKHLPGSHASTLAIVGATLIDGSGGSPVADSAVVIRNGRIVAAGPRGRTTIPRDAQVVDAQGKFLLPGLWDMHAHFEQVEWELIYLAAGVTTVRDCGNEFEFITSVRDAIAAGRGLGPRLLLAGFVDGTSVSAIGTTRVDTPEQARAWVDRYHAAGFEQMKIYSSVNLDEVKAVAEEAHRLGMTVTGHVPEGLTAYQVIDAGQDQINHIPYIADIMRAQLPATAARSERQKAAADLDLGSPEALKAVAYLKAHHTVVDPTLSVYELFNATTARPPASFEPGIEKIPAELAQPLTDVGPPDENSELGRKIFQKSLAIVGALHKAGVPIVAGTDQAVPGHSLHREMELYVKPDSLPWKPFKPRPASPRA